MTRWGSPAVLHAHRASQPAAERELQSEDSLGPAHFIAQPTPRSVASPAFSRPVEPRHVDLRRTSYGRVMLCLGLTRVACAGLAGCHSSQEVEPGTWVLGTD